MRENKARAKISTRVVTGHGKPGSHGKVMEIDLVWKSHGDMQKKRGKVMEICLTLEKIMIFIQIG